MATWDAPEVQACIERTCDPDAIAERSAWLTCANTSCWEVESVRTACDVWEHQTVLADLTMAVGALEGGGSWYFGTVDGERFVLGPDELSVWTDGDACEERFPR